MEALKNVIGMILCLQYIKMMLALWNLSKLLTQRITQECINRDLTPVLNCESGNIALFKTALSVGFEIQQYYLHPDYKI